MPSDGDRLAGRLLDIVENIDKSRAFCAGYDFARFGADDRTFYAVVRALEIVSEAARHIPEEIAAQYPNIAWRQIQGRGQCLPSRLQGHRSADGLGYGSASPFRIARGGGGGGSPPGPRRSSAGRALTRRVMRLDAASRLPLPCPQRRQAAFPARNPPVPPNP